MSSSGGSGGAAAKAKPGTVKEHGGGKGKGAAVPDGKKGVDGSGKSFSVIKQKPMNVVFKLEPGAVKEHDSGKGKGAAMPDGNKKVGGSGKSISVVKQKPMNVVFKLEGKKVTSSSTTKRRTTKVKAQKKVYSLPGQKYDIPEEREPLRIFYESLSKQIPSSEMAEFWMMEHGLLSPERAKKAYERKQKRQQHLRMGTPIKSIRQERPSSSKELQASKNGDVRSKKRVNYRNVDDVIVKSKKSKV